MTIWFSRSNITDPNGEILSYWVLNDYGTRIEIKCHKPLTRQHQTRSGQTCVNWKTLDSLVEPLDKYSKEYENDYNTYSDWVNPETIGITWNDSYCRSITDSLATGCFVKRSINGSEMADDCSGLGFKYLHH